MRKLLLFFFLLSMSPLMQAQSTVVDTAVLKREYYPVSWQTSLNFHCFSPAGHQFYLQALMAFPEYGSLAEAYRFRAQTGYEFKASDHWRIALGAKLNYAEYSKYLLPRISIAHHGQIAKLDFIKEFNGELTYNLEKNSNTTSIALISALVGLGKEFKIGEQRFYTAFSYKLYLYLLTKDTGFNIFKNRTFDHAQMRLDFQYILNEQFRVGIYGTLDSDYYYTLGGISSVSGPFPDARVNMITPMLGLQLHFILKGDRREGYLPLWPSK